MGKKRVPATVQPSGVVAELEQDLLHLKGGRQGLDEDGGTDGVVRHADVGLGEQEDVIPETSFEVMFHLGKIEVRAEATVHQLLGVVVKIEGKVE